MSQLPPAAPSSSPADPAAADQAAADFDVTLHAFWQKNRNFLLGACVVVLLVIVGREGWQYYSTQHALGVQEDFAAAGAQPAKLTAFAAANAGEPLAGVAYLKLADSAYAAADFTGAAANYQKAVAVLTNDALLGRAKLGAAMSAIASGDKTGGEASLKVLGNDPVLLKSVRTEALYHLATLAVAAGRADEAKQLVEQISQVDPTGGWSQRATLLLTTLPAPAATPKPAADAISFAPKK